MLARRFQAYDHGLDKNLRAYESETPPEYDLSAIKGMPCALFCGKKDQLSSPEDYKWIRDQLAEQMSCVFFKEYDMGHLAFLMPPDNRFFFEMLELIRRANPDYQPKPLGGQSAEQLLLLRETEEEVESNMLMMLGPGPAQQKPPLDFAVKEAHF